MATPTYIAKDRHGAFLFRIKIPKHLLPLFSGRKAITKSLKTYHRPTALKLARRYALKVDDLFYKLDMKSKYLFDKTVLTAKRSIAKAKLDDLTGNLSPEALALLQAGGADSSLELDEYIDSASPIDEDIQRIEDKIEKLNRKIKIVDAREQRNEVMKELEEEADKTPRLSDAMTLFVQSKELEGVVLAQQKQIESKWAGYTPHFRLFLAVVGNKKTGQINTDDLNGFKQIVPQMPNANRSGMAELLTFDYQFHRFKTPLQEIFSRSKEQGVPRLGQRTIKEYYSYIVGLLEWFSTENDFLSTDISTKAKSILSESKVPDTRENRREQNFKEFTQEQLSTLFGSGCYLNELPNCTKGRVRKIYTAADFWLPLVALFTGARGKEIAQLFTKDIQNINGTWCFAFTDENDDGYENDEKSVKNQHSNRHTPIHDELIRIGLLEYHKEVAIRNEEKLFPELWKTETGKTDPYKNWGKSFREGVIRKVLGADAGAGKVFHSFRDTFITELQRKGVSEELRKQLVGHSKGRDAHARYSKGWNLPDLQKALNKARYEGVDFLCISWGNFKKRK